MAVVNRRSLEHAYAYLRLTPPFNRWKLPYPHEIRFYVTRTTTMYGTYDHDPNAEHEHTICASAVKNDDTETLMATMAHEMVHLHLGRRDDDHGPKFKRCAALVCKHHGFNLEEF